MHTIVGKLKLAKVFNPKFKVDQNRTIRIWLPTDYSNKRKKPYKVIYMFDGQNLFDEQTSFIGKEWQIDETIEELKKLGYESSIVVGIDNSSDRNNEFTPAFNFKFDKPFSALDAKDIFPCGEATMEYLVESVIPYIEVNYNVGTSKEYRSIGGSSLGGLMATLGIIMYPDIFNSSLAFSPAYQLYDCVFKEGKVYEKILDILTDTNHINKNKIIFCVGGKGFEESFVQYVRKIKEELIKKGYNANLLYTLANKKYSHNETQWAHFFKQAYKKIANKG